MSQCVVVGAGMRGIVAATLLRRGGHDVALVDSAPIPGGVLCSRPWGELYLDNGCHLFDFSHAASAQLYEEILGEQMHPVECRYASVNRGVRSDGLALADMSGFPATERESAIRELEAQVESDATAPPRHPQTLADALLARYGATAGAYAVQCARKMTALDPASLASQALETLPVLSRMRLGSDGEMALLKQQPRLDERLAVSRSADTRQFFLHGRPLQHRNWYPSQQGMRGFCLHAADFLQRIGVRVQFGVSIESIDARNGCDARTVRINLRDNDPVDADIVYWALPSSLFCRTMQLPDPLAGCMQPVAMALFYFKVAQGSVTDLTYVHDFSDTTLCFRASTAGAYGQQVDSAGDTYVCAEVPVQVESPLWHDVEARAPALWEELQALGIVTAQARYTASKVDRHRVTYMLPKPGWAAARNALDPVLAPYTDRVLFGDAAAFGKSAIVDAVAADLRVLQ